MADYTKNERQFIVLNALENAIYRQYLWRDPEYVKMDFEEFCDEVIPILVERLALV
jgi:hypothetical protein